MKQIYMIQSVNNLIGKVYDKVKNILKQCEIDLETYKKQLSVEAQLMHVCSALDQIKKYIISIRNLTEEYRKLEQHIQKQQSQIRKHFGIEQQFKIYSQSLKQDIQQLQKNNHKLTEQLQETSTQRDLYKQDFQAVKQKIKIKKYSNLVPSTARKDESSYQKPNAPTTDFYYLHRQLKTQANEASNEKSNIKQLNLERIESNYRAQLEIPEKQKLLTRKRKLTNSNMKKKQTIKRQETTKKVSYQDLINLKQKKKIQTSDKKNSKKQIDFTNSVNMYRKE